MVDMEDNTGTRDSSWHQPSWQKKNHTTIDARFAKVTPFFLYLDFLLAMQMFSLSNFSYSSSLSSPLTKYQTSTQTLQTWMQGNNSSTWSPSPPALPPRLLYHFHCLTQSFSNGLQISLHHLQPPVQHSGPAQPLPLTMKEDDMILMSALIIHGRPSASPSPSKAVLHKLFPHSLVSQLLRCSTLSTPL
jgi:hypothetical protein